MSVAGGEEMSKHIVFNDSDESLIKEIKSYQMAHGLPSFVAAVRKLCKDALQVARITH